MAVSMAIASVNIIGSYRMFNLGSTVPYVMKRRGTSEYL